MKDKIIFFISLILVIAGIGYLGYTAYKFFTRDSATNQNQQQNQKEQEKSFLELQGSSNKELLAENLNVNDSVSINAEIKNTSDLEVSEKFEGRVYKIDTLYTFPNFDSDLPSDLKDFDVKLNANETSTYTYEYTIEECGNYFMALASENYWLKGTGVVSYGYFSIPCEQKETTMQNDNSLKPVDTTREKSTVGQGKVQGTKTTKGGEPVSELPKAGSKENLIILLGIFAVLGGFTLYKKAEVK